MFQKSNNKNKRSTMRRYIFLFSALALFVIGCSQESNMIASDNKVNTNTPNWIALPQAEVMQVNAIVSTSKTIDGPKGGTIALNNSYSSGLFGIVTLTSSLIFPKGSHPGKVTFTVSHDDSYCVSTFGPSYKFSKELTLNVKYTGVNLLGINPSTVKFVYLAADGSFQCAQNDGITVNFFTGTLEVINAKIPHFSRYGFVN
jgi:hypothetical protein